MTNNYYKTKESVEEYINLAKDINGTQLINELKKHLSVNSILLEIGSGPGSDFQILKKYYKVVGSDFSNEFLDRLKVRFAKDEFLDLNAITLETHKKFDGIYSNKVLQHIANQELQKSIMRQKDILNREGIICHSFWKGEGDEMYNGLLVNYQTKESLEKLFEGYFEILHLKEYREFEDEDSILLIGRKR